MGSDDVSRLDNRCDGLDEALCRALARIGDLERRLNMSADTIPAPPGPCDVCDMQACTCAVGVSER